MFLNNKGHGAPQIPDWFCIVAIIILFLIPFAAIDLTMIAIHGLGFLHSVNSHLTALIITVVFFIYVYAYANNDKRS